MKRSSNRFPRAIIAVLRLVILPVALLIAGIWTVLFGWWLSPLLSHLSEKELKEEIQQSVPALFAEHGGKFVPNPQEPTKGSDAVTVLAEGILFQFARWRDEITIKVAPESSPTKLSELIALVKDSCQTTASREPEAYFTLGQFARFLDAHFETIRGEMQDRGERKRES
jgi:hypothetical protein